MVNNSSPSAMASSSTDVPASQDGAAASLSRADDVVPANVVATPTAQSMETPVIGRIPLPYVQQNFMPSCLKTALRNGDILMSGHRSELLVTAHYLLRNKVMPQMPCHGKNAPESAASHSRTKTWQPRERMSLAAAAVPAVTEKNAVEHLLVRGIGFSYAVMSFAPSVPLPQVIICVLSLLQLTVDCSLKLM